MDGRIYFINAPCSTKVFGKFLQNINLYTFLVSLASKLTMEVIKYAAIAQRNVKKVPRSQRDIKKQLNMEGRIYFIITACSTKTFCKFLQSINLYTFFDGLAQKLTIDVIK